MVRVHDDDQFHSRLRHRERRMFLLGMVPRLRALTLSCHALGRLLDPQGGLEPLRNQFDPNIACHVGRSSRNRHKLLRDLEHRNGHWALRSLGCFDLQNFRE